MADYDVGTESEFSEPESTEDRMADISSDSESEQLFREVSEMEMEMEINLRFIDFDRLYADQTVPVAASTAPADELESTLSSHLGSLHLSDPPILALPGTSKKDDKGDEREIQYDSLGKEVITSQPGTSQQGFIHLFCGPAESKTTLTAKGIGLLSCNPWKIDAARVEWRKESEPAGKPEVTGAAVLPKPGRGTGRRKSLSPRSRSRSRSPLMFREQTSEPISPPRSSKRRKFSPHSDSTGTKPIRQRSPTSSLEFWSMVRESLAEVSSSTQSRPEMPQYPSTDAKASKLLSEGWQNEKAGGARRRYLAKQESKDKDDDNNNETAKE